MLNSAKSSTLSQGSPPMPKYRIYLDTSVVSALHDSRNPERQSLTREFFSRIDEFVIFISELTLAEIEATPDEDLKAMMVESVARLDVLEGTTEVERIAKWVVDSGAMPIMQKEDALHIAFALVYGMDFLLSWNFKHIVRRRTRDAVRLLSTTAGYRSMEILSPPELL